MTEAGATDQAETRAGSDTRRSSLRVILFTNFAPVYQLAQGWAARHGHTLHLVVTTPGPTARRSTMYQMVIEAGVVTSLAGDASPCIAVLGEGGSGKSVALWRQSREANDRGEKVLGYNLAEWQAEANKIVGPELVMMADREPVTVAASQCAIYLSLDGELLDLKYRAMLCQESQVGPLISLAGPDVYRAMLAEEAFTDERGGSR